MKRCITFLLSAILLFSVLSIFSVCSAATVSYDTSWYRASDEVLYLEDSEDFLGFGYLLATKNTFSGKTIELLCDVTLNQEDLSAEGLNTSSLISWYNTGEQNFAGNFEGNNHTISGLYYSAPKDYMGIFGKPQGTTACVRNLSIVNSLLVSGKAKYVGSIFGQIYTTTTVTLENLYVDVEIQCGTSQANVGGLVGRSQSALLSIDSCVFAGTVDAPSASNVGGLIGIANYGSFSLSDCASYGTVSGSVGSVGGLMGTVSTAGTIFCSVADAAIDSAAEQGGAFYGAASVAATLQNNLYTATEHPPIPGTEVTETRLGEYALVDSEQLFGLEAMLTLTRYGLKNWKADRQGYALPRAVASMRSAGRSEGETEPFGTKLVGYQLSCDITDTFSLRIVGVVDSLSYDAVGLDVSAYGENPKIGTKRENRQFQSVYKTIVGYGAEETRIDYTAQDLGGSYIFALNINNIPVKCGTIRFTLQSYHISGGQTVPDGEQIVFDLNTDVLGTAKEAAQ